MHIFFHKVEKIVDKLIPYCLILLLPIIIIEIFYKDFAHHHHTAILITDGVIVFIFIIDLIFKYIRMRNIKFFFRTYWLDLLAVVPFYAIFRIFDQIFILFTPIAETLQSSQMILHEGLEIEKEGSRIVKEAGKTSRYNKLLQFVTGKGTRFLRFAKAISFFEKPTGKHHPRDKK
mgnify:CR=1 FL=1